MFDENKRSLCVEIGGIIYDVDCMLDHGNITWVNQVRIYLGIDNEPIIPMDDSQLDDFFDRYKDDLNDALNTENEED